MSVRSGQQAGNKEDLTCCLLLPCKEVGMLFFAVHMTDVLRCFRSQLCAALCCWSRRPTRFLCTNRRSGRCVDHAFDSTECRLLLLRNPPSALNVSNDYFFCCATRRHTRRLAVCPTAAINKSSSLVSRSVPHFSRTSLRRWFASTPSIWSWPAISFTR